ncbi:MAG: CBS domain-containing protein [Hyphomicrobiales bacterium]|nr:CBS domain-containing protein [Hyphomicrobiales bacterium]
MSVSRILAEKGHEVQTIQPHRTLAEAAAILSERKIGAAVVTGADGAVLGILSERDIVRALAQNGANALDEPVSRRMTAKVTTCSAALSIESAMEIMTTGKFRHLPVVQDGRLAGIISIGDVVKRHIEKIEAETRAMRDYISMA